MVCAFSHGRRFPSGSASCRKQSLLTQVPLQFQQLLFPQIFVGSPLHSCLVVLWPLLHFCKLPSGQSLKRGRLFLFLLVFFHGRDCLVSFPILPDHVLIQSILFPHLAQFIHLWLPFYLSSAHTTPHASANAAADSSTNPTCKLRFCYFCRSPLCHISEGQLRSV